MFCLIRLHIAALRCKQQFCIQYVAGGIKELQILPTCTSHVWHTCCGQFIHLACWTFSEWCSSCLMEDAGCGVFLHALFSSCGHVETWLGDTDRTVWRRRSELCTLQRFPWFYSIVSNYICRAAYAHRVAWPRKGKKRHAASRLEAGRLASCCRAELLSGHQRWRYQARQLSQAGCSSTTEELRRAAGRGEEPVSSPHQLALPWADGKGLLSDFLSVLDLWR